MGRRLQRSPVVEATRSSFQLQRAESVEDLYSALDLGASVAAVFGLFGGNATESAICFCATGRASIFREHRHFAAPAFGSIPSTLAGKNS
jgi:hypothetical protein